MKNKVLFQATLLAGLGFSALQGQLIIEDFSGSSGPPTGPFGDHNFDSIGWSAYATSTAGVEDVSLSVNEFGVSPNFSTYGYSAVRFDDSVDDFFPNAVPHLYFSDFANYSLPTFAIGDLTRLSVDEGADGIGGDLAEVRFAVQVGSQWLASDTLFLGDTDGSGATQEFKTLSLDSIDFADGSHWRQVTFTPGAGGIIAVAGSAVGGSLSGNVNSFGLLLEKPGNDGDHFRFDNFTVSAVPEPAQLAFFFGMACLFFRLRRR